MGFKDEISFVSSNGGEAFAVGTPKVDTNMAGARYAFASFNEASP